jgi:uncharacterized membrane protein YdjX (TVP38/TMEM64 family)
VTPAELFTQPWVYALLLAGGVGLGLPMGAAVVAAGALFGGVLGVVVVVLGQAIGLVINWNLCRHWCRSWIVRRLQRRRRWRWLLVVIDTQLSWPTLLLLRLALLPMAPVSACCALSATACRPYALTSLVLVLRFALMVQAGALGAATARGTASAAQQLWAVAAGVATLFAAAQVVRILRQRLKATPASTAGLR